MYMGMQLMGIWACIHVAVFTHAKRRAEASATNGATAPTNSAQQAATVSTNNTSHSPYEDAAQELYRVTLFAVFYAEVSLAALIPVVGE